MAPSTLVYIDGNDARLAELRQVLGELAPGMEVVVEALQTGFSTSDPAPRHQARDKVAAHPVAGPCFAEALDLTTVDGKSLRLELDSENDNRFCKWWRETPARLHAAVAVRRHAGAEVEVFAAVCPGRIADRPAGPPVLGWERLFVPDEQPAAGPAPGPRTLAELTARGLLLAFRRGLYGDVARALAGAGPA